MSSTRARVLLIAFLLLAAAVAWVASETFGFIYIDILNVMRAWRQTQGILLVGNSVIDTVSHCDDDPRSIAEMLSAYTAQPVLDLSRGGMQLDQEFALIHAGTLGRGGRRIVLPLSINDQLFKHKEPAIGHDAWLLRLKGGAHASGAVTDLSYKGVHYGSYADYAAKYFPAEKNAAQCPETNVLNSDFVEFMYWSSFARHTDLLSDQARWMREMKRIQGSGNQLLVTIMPYDRQMIARYFGEAEVARIDAQVALAAGALRGAGIATLDLSKMLAPTDFTDIWCACGHLNQSGRGKVAAALAEGLRRR